MGLQGKQEVSKTEELHGCYGNAYKEDGVIYLSFSASRCFCILKSAV